EEALVDATLPTERAVQLLQRRDFRRTYSAIVVSELGDAFQYVALMWFALVAAGPLGILAVRLADSVPALLFGLHGGVVADRRDRRATMITSDLVRGAVLVPVGLAGLAGHLHLLILVVPAFVAVTISSGTWMVGVPQLVRKTLDLGAGSFSLVAGAYAVGAVASGALLSRIRVRQKVRLGLLLWTGYAAGYALFAVAGSLPLVLV